MDLGGNPIAPGPAGAAGNWQLIARGIEDMQIRYRAPNGAQFGAANCCALSDSIVLGMSTRTSWGGLVVSVGVSVGVSVRTSDVESVRTSDVVVSGRRSVAASDSGV